MQGLLPKLQDVDKEEPGFCEEGAGRCGKVVASTFSLFPSFCKTLFQITYNNSCMPGYSTGK